MSPVSVRGLTGDNDPKQGLFVRLRLYAEDTGRFRELSTQLGVIAHVDEVISP